MAAKSCRVKDGGKRMRPKRLLKRASAFSLALFLSFSSVSPIGGVLTAHAETVTNWTNQPVTVTVTAHDVASPGGSASEVLSYSKDGVFWQSDNKLEYRVEEGNPTIGATSLYVKDDVGNVTKYDFRIDNIDVNEPIPTVTSSNENPCNTQVTLTCNATDDQSGVKEYSWDNQSTWSTSGNTLVAKDNGEFTCFVKDNAGNVASDSYTVSNIDKVAPIIETLTPDTKEATNGNVKITVKYHDNEGGLGFGYIPAFRYSVEGAKGQKEGTSNKWVTSDNFTVSKNGTYKVELRDSAGNSTSALVVVSNIDKVAPTINSFVADKTELTNSAVVLTVTAEDDYCGLDATAYSYDNKATWVSDNTLTVTDNGTYKVFVKDKAGNISSQDIVVSNIDKLLPVIDSFTSGLTTPTNTNVTLSVVAHDQNATSKDAKSDLQTEAYSYDGKQTWVSDTDFVVSVNGTYTVYVRDVAGNIESKSLEVSNIDKTKPYFNTVTPDSTEFTNGDINVVVDAADGGLGLASKPYSYDSGATWTNVNNKTYTLIGSYEIQIKDLAGNVERYTIQIPNIDKLDPVIDSVSSDTTEPYNQPMDISVVAHDQDATEDYSKSDLSATAYAYVKAEMTGELPELTWVSNSSLEISENGLYTVYVRDTAGNVVNSGIEVTNLDMVKPVFDSVTITPETWTNGTVDINVAVSDDYSGVDKISFDGGTTWGDLTNHTVSNNGLVNIQVRDLAGNITEYPLTISNIDKEAPVNTVTKSSTDWTVDDVTYEFDIADNVLLKYAKVCSGTTASDEKLLDYHEYLVEDNIQSCHFEYTVSDNADFFVVAEDFGGNHYEEVISVENIDKVAPTIGGVAADVTEFTSSNVKLTLSPSDGYGEVAYVICPNGEKLVASPWEYVVSTNGTYEFTVFDKAGNFSKSSIGVGNIDKEDPTVEVTPSTTDWAQEIEFSLKATDNLGVSSITLPDNTVVNGTEAVFKVTANGSYVFVITDLAGNRHICEVKVSTIDLTAPSFSIGLTNTYWTTGDNTIVVNANDSESGLNASAYSYDGGQSWVSSGRYTISDGGTYTVWVRDAAGNSASGTVQAVKSPVAIVYTEVINPPSPSIEQVPSGAVGENAEEIIALEQAEEEETITVVEKPNLFVGWIQSLEVKQVVKTTAVVTGSALILFILAWTISMLILLKMGRGVKYYAIVEDKKVYLGMGVCRRRGGAFKMKMRKHTLSKYVFENDFAIDFKPTFVAVNNGKTVVVKCGKAKAEALVGKDTTFNF